MRAPSGIMRAHRRGVRLLLVLMFGATPVLAAGATGSTPVVLPYSERWDMHSAITGRDYRICVYKPPGAVPKGGLPLVVLTDADVFFPLAVGQMLSRAPNEIRPALVVGISYPTLDIPTITRLRIRDLTPSAPAETPAGLRQIGVGASGMGGGEPFYRFITQELQPRLAKRYRLDASDRTLFGHSLGGLFALRVLLNHPGAFQTYVAASPWIMWNGGAILKDLPGFARAVSGGQRRLRVLLTVGGNEADADAVPLGPTPRADIVKTLAEYDAVENVNRLADTLSRIPAVDAHAQVFPDENHVSVQPASLARALTFALAKPTYGDPCPWPCRTSPAGRDGLPKVTPSPAR